MLTLHLNFKYIKTEKNQVPLPCVLRNFSLWKRNMKCLKNLKLTIAFCMFNVVIIFFFLICEFSGKHFISAVSFGFAYKRNNIFLNKMLSFFR